MDKYNKDDHTPTSELAEGDFYFENGLMVMTEQYHLSRGYCCGSKCRHCPYDHINVSQPKKQ